MGISSIMLVALCLFFLFGLRGCSTTHEYEHNPVEIHPDFDLNPRIHEFIQNRIESHPDIRLAVHCQSLDDDLGLHILLLREEISWTFRQNLFGTSTYFWCKMAWHDHEGRFAYASFDVYRDTVYSNPNCQQCHWDAREDGIFLNDVKQFDWEFYDLQ